MDTQITEDRFLEYMAMDFPTFKVTKCNLAYPTADFVTSFYVTMIEAVTGIKDADQLWSFTEEQCVEIQSNPNEGNSFIQHLYSRNLHATVKYIFSQLNPNVPEFKYSDILFPENTPRRTFVFMSLMLSFFYYYVGFSDDIDEDMIASSEKGREITSMKELKLKLTSQIRELENQKAEYIESCKNAKSNILYYSSCNNEKENILKELHTMSDLLDGDMKKVEEKESNLQEELIKIENDVKYYETLIVSNPDEAAEVHANHEMKKVQCKNKMKALEEEVRVASLKLSRLNRLTELQQSLNSIIMKSDANCTDWDKLDFKELQNCINNLNSKLSNLISSESGVSGKLTERELMISKLKSELAQNESEEALIISKGEDRCRTYNGYIENQEKLFTEMTIKVKKDEEEAEEINSCIEDLAKNCAEIEDAIKTFDKTNEEKYLWCNKEIKAALSNIQRALTL